MCAHPALGHQRQRSNPATSVADKGCCLHRLHRAADQPGTLMIKGALHANGREHVGHCRPEDYPLLLAGRPIGSGPQGCQTDEHALFLQQHRLAAVHGVIVLGKIIVDIGALHALANTGVVNFAAHLKRRAGGGDTPVDAWVTTTNMNEFLDKPSSASVVQLKRMACDPPIPSSCMLIPAAQAADYGLFHPDASPLNLNVTAGQNYTGDLTGVLAEFGQASITSAGTIRVNGTSDSSGSLPDAGIIFGQTASTVTNSGSVSGTNVGITTTYA